MKNKNGNVYEIKNTVYRGTDEENILFHEYELTTYSKVRINLCISEDIRNELGYDEELKSGQVIKDFFNNDKLIENFYNLLCEKKFYLNIKYVEYLYLDRSYAYNWAINNNYNGNVYLIENKYPEVEKEINQFNGSHKYTYIKKFDITGWKNEEDIKKALKLDNIIKYFNDKF